MLSLRALKAIRAAALPPRPNYCRIPHRSYNKPRRPPRQQQPPQTSQQQAYQPPPNQSHPHPQPQNDLPPKTLLYILGGYFAVVNAGSVGLFWYDKQQAQRRGWRVPEKQLQFSALLGGWVGGMWAMKTFRHKTVKQSFKEPYMMCVAGNVLACMGAAAAWKFRILNFSQLLGRNLRIPRR